MGGADDNRGTGILPVFYVTHRLEADATSNDAQSRACGTRSTNHLPAIPRFRSPRLCRLLRPAISPG